jgi:hypothetical protein
MPPGQDPIPEAHTSVPAAGVAGRPVNTMSRNTVPDMKTSTRGGWVPLLCSALRRSASGSHQTGSCAVSTVLVTAPPPLSPDARILPRPLRAWQPFMRGSA